MPTLPNARHERFAQGLAAGFTPATAYEEAGYKPNRGNASTLNLHKSISNRAQEILEERDRIHGAAVAKAVKNTAVTGESLLNELEQGRQKAMESKQYSAAVQAIREKVLSAAKDRASGGQQPPPGRGIDRRRAS
jgi:hypothetical protein